MVQPSELGVGSLLAAHPLLSGPFERTVVLICTYDQNRGAHGLVLNAAEISTISLSALLPQVEVNARSDPTSENATDSASEAETMASSIGEKKKDVDSSNVMEDDISETEKRRQTHFDKVLRKDSLPVYWGGPVADGLFLRDMSCNSKSAFRQFLQSGKNEVSVLHPYADLPGAVHISKNIYLGFNRDEALKQQSRLNCERDVLAYVGYASWSPGQLESELEENSWFVFNGDGVSDFVFSRSFMHRDVRNSIVSDSISIQGPKSDSRFNASVAKEVSSSRSSESLNAMLRRMNLRSEGEAEQIRLVFPGHFESPRDVESVSDSEEDDFEDEDSGDDDSEYTDEDQVPGSVYDVSKKPSDANYSVEFRVKFSGADSTAEADERKEEYEEDMHSETESDESVNGEDDGDEEDYEVNDDDDDSEFHDDSDGGVERQSTDVSMWRHVMQSDGCPELESMSTLPLIRKLD
eukprot:CAMPEP_0182447656 /NCGR_PEP_ID=MMETSP1172-20130603/18463_1 /TAXON_ID=708627 /ORGANISM="Timspurckia oligopyrenoides, Strain CCMP3278" /LENGTH=464 /DNA_ID=CAMNT_0024644173 /DNA_START=572 /DNA_END=1966 /DNA_ORIENTATION=-